MGRSEADRLRIQDEEFADELTREDQPTPQGSLCLVALTAVKSSYPTQAQAFFWMEPQIVLGTEAEGEPALLQPMGGGFFAFNLGSAVPPEGTPVICECMEYRWIFRYS